MSQEFVSMTEAAEALGVHRKTVLGWIRKGYISAHRLPSGRHRIPASEVLRMQKEIKEGGKDDDRDE